MNNRKFFFLEYPKVTLIGITLLCIIAGLTTLEVFVKPRIIKSINNPQGYIAEGLTYKGDGILSEDSILEPNHIFDSSSGVTVEDTKQHLILHKTMGYSYPRNSKSIIKKTFAFETFVHATYSFDKHRRRITPIEDESPKKINALFFGCSFTMGDSLNDNQTIPFYFSQHMPQVRSFNYGLGGSGPSQMLYQIESRDFSIELPQAEKNIGFYVYADGHLERASVDLERSTWLRESPYYQLKKNKLQAYKNFTYAKPNYSVLYDLINKSSLAQKLAYPNASLFNHQSRQDSLHQTIAIIKRAKETFEKRVPSSSFYVLLFPGHSDSGFNLKTILHDNGIKSMELKIPDGKTSFIIHEKETHLNEKANFLMAQGLARDIRKIMSITQSQ